MTPSLVVVPASSLCAAGFEVTGGSTNAGVPPITNGFVCERRDGFYCAATDDPATTACAALKPDGAICNFDSTCASGACTGGESVGDAACAQNER